MTVFSYKTIDQPSDSIYKEKGSRFLAFAFPVGSEADVKEALESLRKKYYDARHHCFAWVLGPEKKLFRAFDDGEPNHSAGDPILGQIRSRDLTNVLVVVVRYFGGTKLGVGGLISAYKTAAGEALDKASIVVRDVTETFVIRYSYEFTPEVMKMVKEFSLTILDQKYDEVSEITATITLQRKDVFLERVKLMNALGKKLIVVSL
jgi:uncharacterized YigZ family protein